jgi:hypothetical protein
MDFTPTAQYAAMGARSRKRPSLQQFDTMQFFPFQHVSQRSFRKIAIDATRFGLDSDLEIAVDRVKMSQPVVAVVHRDHDPKKATQLGHASL